MGSLKTNWDSSLRSGTFLLLELDAKYERIFPNCFASQWLTFLNKRGFDIFRESPFVLPLSDTGSRARGWHKKSMGSIAPFTKERVSNRERQGREESGLLHASLGIETVPSTECHRRSRSHKRAVSHAWAKKRCSASSRGTWKCEGLGDTEGPLSTKLLASAPPPIHHLSEGLADMQKRCDAPLCVSRSNIGYFCTSTWNGPKPGLNVPAVSCSWLQCTCLM